MNTHSVFKGFVSVPMCISRPNWESGRKGGWSLLWWRSWIQKQMCRHIQRECRIDQREEQTRRCQVGGLLIVEFILVSCTCVKIGLCLILGPFTHLLLFQQRQSLWTVILPGPGCPLDWHPLWSQWMSQPYRWWAWIFFCCTCVWLLLIGLGLRHIFLVWWLLMHGWRCKRPWLGLQIPPMWEGCGCVLDVEVS